MTPPLGTQVDFYGSGHGPDTSPQLGFIVQTWEDGTVNVAVFDRNGKPLLDPPTQIPLVESGADRPEGPCCAVTEKALVESLGDSDHRAVNLLKEKLGHLGARLDAVGERLDLQARRISELQDSLPSPVETGGGNENSVPPARETPPADSPSDETEAVNEASEVPGEEAKAEEPAAS